MGLRRVVVNAVLCCPLCTGSKSGFERGEGVSNDIGVISKERGDRRIFRFGEGFLDCWDIVVYEDEKFEGGEKRTLGYPTLDLDRGTVGQTVDMTLNKAAEKADKKRRKRSLAEFGEETRVWDRIKGFFEIKSGNKSVWMRLNKETHIQSHLCTAAP